MFWLSASLLVLTPTIINKFSPPPPTKVSPDDNAYNYK